MAKQEHLLVEIGTEELPPKALRSLMEAFAQNLSRGLAEARLEHGDVRSFASPRRLAVRVDALATRQPDRTVDAKGPPVKIAFNDAGEAQPAALAFAKKCGVPVESLDRVKTKKGEWLAYTSTEQGADAADLLGQLVNDALKNLPIPRRMRWGNSDTEFVRPVHWIVLLLGSRIVNAEIMGHAAGRITRGHRFMSSGELEVSSAENYPELLETSGHVIADFTEREKRVRDQVVAAADAAGGKVVVDDSLFDEVAALTEWPVAMTGHFDEEYLALPDEVIIASLTGHQRYFPVADKDGCLLSAFVFVANLESRDPGQVREGNERVIRPRLADAAFFWETDRKTSLASRIDALDRVVYQQGLGSLRDKSRRVQIICDQLADRLGVDGSDAARAAALAKCDLLTGMVGEFPELQGTMGAYYAVADGESAEVANAIGQHYLPRFAGDAIPESPAGRLLALADKLDTLAGVFSIGKKPTGNKDPFGLRRAALGVVRILLEGGLELSLSEAVKSAASVQPEAKNDTADDLLDFVRERMRSFFVERAEISAEMFEAVATIDRGSSLPLPDFEQRIQAVADFAAMQEAESLSAANKRIQNILQQAGDQSGAEIDQALFAESAEQDLFEALSAALNDVRPLQDNREYGAVLSRLARLRAPVDRFFDEVMVMADDDALKQNRLALLTALRAPFTSVADISRLSVNK